MTKAKFEKGEKVTYWQHNGISSPRHGYYHSNEWRGRDGKNIDIDKHAQSVKRRLKDGSPCNRLSPVWGKIEKGWV